MLALLDALNPEKLLSTGGPLLLFAIIFAESGLLIGFFLPGDSLLFTAGAAAAGAFSESLPDLQLNIWVLLIGCFIAAAAGDQVGYLIGLKAGPRVFNRPDSRLFKQSHVNKGTEFFEEHGGRAIIMARFVPIVRTFVPTIAGVSKMPYHSFVRFNLIGAFVWAVGVTLAGYLFGGIEVVKNNIEIALLGVVAVSFIPVVYEIVNARRNASRKAAVEGD